MKKTGLLNQPLSAMIAGLGHTDTIVITDAGLSISPTTQRIDLAVSEGIPGLLDVMRAILGEMQIGGAVVASELAEHSPNFYADLVKLLPGEFTPFTNIILISEVIF